MADHPDFTEKQLATRLAYDGQLLKVREDTVLLPDGKTARREYIQHPGAAIIIPLLDAATVLLERQFRYPLGRHFYELPAGKINPGEDALTTAQRELIEECGYEARSWRHLATLHPCIGYSDERIEIFWASGLIYVGHQRDHGEFLEVVEMSVADSILAVRDGEITDGKTITALMWADKIASGSWRVPD